MVAPGRAQVSPQQRAERWADTMRTSITTSGLRGPSAGVYGNVTIARATNPLRLPRFPARALMAATVSGEGAPKVKTSDGRMAPTVQFSHDLVHKSLDLCLAPRSVTLGRLSTPQQQAMGSTRAWPRRSVVEGHACRYKALRPHNDVTTHITGRVAPVRLSRQRMRGSPPDPPDPGHPHYSTISSRIAVCNAKPSAVRREQRYRPTH
jgi:hypothetical protein